MAKVSGEVAERLMEAGIRVGDILKPLPVCGAYPTSKFLVLDVPTIPSGIKRESSIVLIDITGRGGLVHGYWSLGWLRENLELIEIGRTDLFIAAPHRSPIGYVHAIVKIKSDPVYTAGCRAFTSCAAGSRHWSEKRHPSGKLRVWERLTNVKLWKEARKLGWVTSKKTAAKKVR